MGGQRHGSRLIQPGLDGSRRTFEQGLLVTDPIPETTHGGALETRKCMKRGTTGRAQLMRFPFLEFWRMIDLASGPGPHETIAWR